MAFLNEESLTENVKKFPVLYDKSNDEFSLGKTSKKIHVQKLLNPLEERMNFRKLLRKFSVFIHSFSYEKNPYM